MLSNPLKCIITRCFTHNKAAVNTSKGLSSAHVQRRNYIHRDDKILIWNNNEVLALVSTHHTHSRATRPMSFLACSRSD